MSFVLGLSFEYHRYQRDAVIKIYADDQLVDEFSLTKDIKLKTIKTSSLYHRYQRDAVHHHFTVEKSHTPPSSDKSNPPNYTRVAIFPEKLFLFEISEKFLHNQIRIEVENGYNNHTNGFMTEYAYLEFHHLFVIPTCLLQYKTWTELPLFFDIDQDTASQEIARASWEAKYGFFVFSLERYELENLIVKSSTGTRKGGFLHFKQGGTFTIEIPLSRTHNIVSAPIEFITPRLLWSFNVLNMSG